MSNLSDPNLAAEESVNFSEGLDEYEDADQVVVRSSGNESSSVLSYNRNDIVLKLKQKELKVYLLII